MALLAFDSAELKSCPVGSLLSSAQRQKTANALNAAILTNKGQSHSTCALQPEPASMIAT